MDFENQISGLLGEVRFDECFFFASTVRKVLSQLSAPVP